MKKVLNKMNSKLVRKRVSKALTRLYSGNLSEKQAEQINPWNSNDLEYTKEFLQTTHILSDMNALSEDKDIVAIMELPNSLLNSRKKAFPFYPVFSIAASLLIVFSLVFVIPKNYFHQATNYSSVLRYSTQIGEQKTITLSDGSIVTLNTATILLVDFSDNHRHLTLKRGEVYFDVAKDANRRFSVGLGEHQVSALGTEFNIKKEPEGFTVTVLEGVVALHQKDESIAKNLSVLTASEEKKVITRGAKLQTHLKAGWVAKVNSTGKLKGTASKETVAKLDDWRDGIVEFNGDPLYQVVKELNRYTQRKILIEDDRIVNLKIFAIFHVDDIDSAILGLTKVIPIKSQYQFDRISLISSAD